MKYGTYFAYWEQEWDVDFFPYIKKMKKLGFDVLEVAAAGLVSMNDEQLAAFKKEAQAEGISITSCIGLPRDCDTSSTDESVRQKGVAYLKQIMDAMDKIDSRVLGGIIYAYWPCDYSYPVDKPAARAQAVKSMREAADYAEKLGIKLVLETVNRFEQFIINDAAEAVQFVKDIGKDNVKVMLDCFHMNIEEDNLADAIRATGDYLGHFHIGEANRKVPGKGHMPWAEMGQALRDINYDGYVVMEPFVKPGGQVGKDIKVWRDLSGNADEAKMDADIAESLRFLKSKFEA